MDFLTILHRFITRHDLLPRGSPGAPNASVIVGVSGGADSLCLLHALHALAPDNAWRLHVAHLNHQLRGAAAQADADFVHDIAQQWNLPSTIESRDVAAFARHHKLSLEEAARQVRYSFLREVARAQHSDIIAVAHNADDQTESVLMHLLRGSGLAGLRGMQSKMRIAELRIGNWDSAVRSSNSTLTDIFLVRPLLEIPRTAIEDYCRQNNLQPRVDATNADTTYFRNRLRHELLPTLETYNPNIRSILRRTADVVAAEVEILQAHTNFAWGMTVVAESVTAVTFDLLLWREQLIGVQRALLRKAIQQLRPSLRDIDFGHIADAIEILQHAHTGDQVTLPQNLLIEVSYATFTLSPREELAQPDWPQLPTGLAPLIINVPGVTPVPESTWVLQAELLTGEVEPKGGLMAFLNAETLPGPLALRPRTSGDRFHPQGMLSPVRLKDWMINARVPRAIRDHLPLITSADQIVWVPGFRVGQPFLVGDGTRQIIKLAFRKG
jgi:tRNA(Ile)-lysidine synthase